MPVLQDCLIEYNKTDLGLCSGPILVSATDVQGVVASGAGIACIAVGTEHSPNQIAQVGYIVHIGQGTGDEQVPLTCCPPICA